MVHLTQRPFLDMVHLSHHGTSYAPYMKHYSYDLDFDGYSPSLSIYPLSDLALPFDFGPKVFTTKPLFASVLKALEDPLQGGCRPREVLSLLTQIVEEADELLPTKGTEQKTLHMQYGDGCLLEVVVSIVMPLAITVLSTPEEAALVAEFASVEG